MDLFEDSDGDVAWDQWIRNAFKSALLQVDISAADFRKLNIQKRGVEFQFGFRHLAHFNG